MWRCRDSPYTCRHMRCTQASVDQCYYVGFPAVTQHVFYVYWEAWSAQISCSSNHMFNWNTLRVLSPPYETNRSPVSPTEGIETSRQLCSHDIAWLLVLVTEASSYLACSTTYLHRVALKACLGCIWIFCPPRGRIKICTGPDQQTNLQRCLMFKSVQVQLSPNHRASVLYSVLLFSIEVWSSISVVFRLRAPYSYRNIQDSANNNVHISHAIIQKM